MGKVSKTLRVVFVVLLVPIMPFALLGWWFEPSITQYSQSLSTAGTVAVAVVGLLAADIFLPVPSSVVSTVAGRELGVFGGTACSALGLSLGSVLGFMVARRWGRPLAENYAGAASLRQMDQWQQNYSTWFLVLSRPLPILAEAAVLLCGINRIAWHRFLPPVLLSNFGLSVAYAALGKYATDRSWFPAAVVLAAAGPLLLSEIARRRYGTSNG